MNLEELKLVLETINNTTGLAKDFGTTWMWLHYGLKVFDAVMVVFCILGVIYGIYRMIVYTTEGSAHDVFMRRCRDRLRIGSPGILTEGEAAQVRNKLSELIDKHLQENKQ